IAAANPSVHLTCRIQILRKKVSGNYRNLINQRPALHRLQSLHRLASGCAAGGDKKASAAKQGQSNAGNSPCASLGKWKVLLSLCPKCAPSRRQAEGVDEVEGRTVMQSGLARRLSRMRRAAACSVITLATAALAGCMAQQHAAPPGSGAHTANNPPAVTAQPRSSAQANGSAGGSSAGATTQPAAPPPPHATGTDAETSD